MAKDQLRPIGDASCNFPRHRLNAQPRDGRHSRMTPASLQIAATLDRLVSRELSMSNAIAKSVGFSEILVATDFSRQADYALEVAKSIARESKGELLLVHVSQPASHIALPEGGWLDVSSLLQQAEDATETAGAVLREEGFRAKALCCYGGVTSEIVREAKENLVDLVVTGTEGKQGLAHFFLGSHAESLAGELTIPLLIIGPRSNIPNKMNGGRRV
jgi:nucleotide-binding universal stress UspA family protein